MDGHDRAGLAPTTENLQSLPRQLSRFCFGRLFTKNVSCFHRVALAGYSQVDVGVKLTSSLRATNLSTLGDC